MESFSRRTAKTEKTCEKAEKLLKYVCFAIAPLKETFAKTLRSPLRNLCKNLAFTVQQVNAIPFPGLKTLLATLVHAFIPHNDLPCRCLG